MNIENWIVCVGLSLMISLSGCVSQVHKGKVVKPVYVNSLGMEFVEIPAGSFMMGSEKGITETLVHKVTLSKFLIMKYEVTNEQFEQFKKVKRSKWSPDPKMPEMNASRAEIIEFIKWLSKKDGRTYALPTDAQWEYAARGGLEGMDYPWGKDWIDGMANIGGEEKPGGAMSTPVGSYPPNAYGLYDMCGNASEMVRERQYDYTAASQIDPIGPVKEPSEDPYIIRGTGIREFFPQVWARFGFYDSVPPYTNGFRLIVEDERGLMK